MKFRGFGDLGLIPEKCKIIPHMILSLYIVMQIYSRNIMHIAMPYLASGFSMSPSLPEVPRQSLVTLSLSPALYILVHPP